MVGDPHARTPQPTRTPSLRWMITVLPVTPHADSSVPMVNGTGPTLKPGLLFTGAASPSEVRSHINGREISRNGRQAAWRRI